MIIVDILPSSIRTLSLKKGFFGISISKKGEIQRTNGALPEKNTLKWLKKKEIAICIPDNKVFIHRFEISTEPQTGSLSDNVQEKISELIPVPIKELCYDFSVLEKSSVSENQSREIFFVGIEKSTLEEFLKITDALETRVSFAIPESLAIYELIKYSLDGPTSVACVNLENQATSIFFLDRYGPITSFSDPTGTGNLNERLKDAMEFFQKKYGKTIKSIVIKGGTERNPQSASVTLSIPVSSIESIIKNTITSNKNFPLKKQQVPEEKYLTVLGAGLISLHSEHVNLMHNYVKPFHLQETSTSSEPKHEVSTTISPSIPTKTTASQTNHEKDSPEDNSKQSSIQSNPITSGKESTPQQPITVPETAEQNQLQSTSNDFLPTQDADQISLKTLDEEDKKDSRKRFFMIVVVVIWIIIMMGGFYFFTRSTNTHIPIKQPAGKPAATTISSSSGSMKKLISSPTPTPVLDRKTLTLEVLNGSGKSGVAGKTASFLEQKGYQNVATGNASGFSYHATQVQIKKSKSEYLSLILSDLAESYQATSASTFLNENNTYDAIVTVGQQ